MNNKIKAVKRFLAYLAGFFPSAVPIGRTDFDTWATSIIDTYQFPDNDSVRFALASIVMHMGPTSAYKPKYYFALVIKAGAAKQVAASVFQDIKNKQVAEAAAKSSEGEQPKATLHAISQT